MFFLQNKNHLVVFFVVCLVGACGDTAVEHPAPTRQTKQALPAHPPSKRSSVPRTSPDMVRAPVRLKAPVVREVTPSKRVPKATRQATGRWAYQAEQCHALLLKTAEAQAKKRDLGYPMPGRGGEYCYMMPYREALSEPPQSQLGYFVLETGDGCREYDSTLVYVFRRATYGKKTKYFIPYTKRPKWLEEQLPGGSAIEAGDAVEMAALYKGDFIVYEIDYSKANKTLDVDIQAKRAMRQAVKSCFKQVGPSKPYHKVFPLKPTPKNRMERCSW